MSRRRLLIPSPCANDKAKMIAVALRCFFFLGAIMFYSTGIWNMINGYFGREFQTYLAQHPPPLKSEPTSPVIIKTTIEATIEEMREGDGDQRKMKIGMMDSGGPSNILELTSPPTVAMRVHTDDDEALIIPSELNQNPIDETWCRWNNYYRENPEGSRSKGEYENYACPTSGRKMESPVPEGDVVVETDAVDDEAVCACDFSRKSCWNA